MRASLISCFVILSFYNPLSLANSKQESLESLLTLGDSSRVAVSAEIRSVSNGKILFTSHAQRGLAPASTTKLLLNAALLSKLTPYFRMKTRLYRTGSVKNGVVTGDLIIVGDGDPFLVSEELFLIASQLQMLGYKSFSGDLILDDSLFVDEAYVKEQNKSNTCLTRAYDAPVSALGVNFNTLSFLVMPANTVGDRASVHLDPFPLKSFKVTDEIFTVEKGPTQIQFDCQKNMDVLNIHLGGRIKSSDSAQHFYRSTSDHKTLNGEMFRAFFSTFGISIRGKTRGGHLPTKADLILTHESKPLSELVKSLAQFSNNYMADVMLKRLAVEEGRKGTFAEGVEVLSSFLKSLGIEDSFVLKDGSGLSYETRLSAEQLNKILLYVARDFRIFPDFLASLPSGGETGTLKQRFTLEGRDDLRGRIRAKTGTLTEPVTVSALVGYFQDPSLGLMSFAILQNGVKGKTQPLLADLHESQEKALAYFLKNYKEHSQNGL